MKRNSFLKSAAASLAIALPVMASAAKTNDEARLLRFPAVGGDNIVFTYAGDLYRVGIDGGDAVRLTSHVGYEMFARFSPDGKTIAFTGQYDGNTEVYTMPVTGGEPKRVTYSALLSRDDIGDRMGPNNIVMCWTPDGKNIVFRSRTHSLTEFRGHLCLVPAEGGVREEIPTSEGGFCSYSPDGKYLAFNRMFREFRTWKYYRGGQADDIWVNEVGTNKIRKICDNDAQDIFPMWIGDDIYYMSDRDRVMNLFVYHNATGKTDKVTDFKEYDCKFPSFSNDWIVFENGGYIYKYSVKSGKCTKVSIRLASDTFYGRPETVCVDRKVSSSSISPDGTRVVMTARGDLFSLPAKQGVVFNVTDTPGAHDRAAAWSPDGKTVAYISDKDGEYQIYAAPAGDMSAAVKLTSFKDGYPVSPVWSPDSKKIYFKVANGQEYCLDIASKSCKPVLKGAFGGISSFTLSPDGTWAAYATALSNDLKAIYLYNVASGKSYQVTDKWYDASSPLFSDDGKYLFFLSSRGFKPIYSDVEWNSVYSLTSNAYFIPLAADTFNPAVIVNDGDPKAAAATDKGGKVVTKVDLEGIGQRITALPVKGGTFYCTVGDKLICGTSDGLKSVDMKTLKVSDAGKTKPVAITPDRKKALINEGGRYAVVSFGEKGCGKADVYVPTGDMVYNLDHKAEWKQIFDESWRITRDFFYVSNMHGANWNKVYAKYAELLPYVRHRHDLTYIIGEVLGELNVGHAYVTSGESPEVPRVATGLLGAKFGKDASTGAFRIDKIYQGANWDKSLRSPLTEPGSEARVGEYVVAVNGVPAKELVDIYQALIGKAEKVVELKVASDAKGSDARRIYVKTISDEAALAYYEWVQNNIRKVEEASNGEIGYIHIPDMGRAGLTAFTKLFYTQLDKKALIVDDRMNGGGNVSPMILERLQREVYRITTSRYGAVNSPVPNQTFYGPQVCLVDKYSASDGDQFPYGYRKLGLGKVIGKRTWGGIVGISGSRRYLDGQDVRTPSFTSYSTEGEWIIEGHGVEPDIDVDINPIDDYYGKDAQLDKAVEVLKAELKNRKELPGTPKAPVKNR